MAKRILIINGHPDPAPGHLGEALAEAYARGAREAGCQVDVLQLALLDFPVLRSRQAWENATPCAAIVDAQQRIREADHLVLVYPLWLGSMPALLKAFLEQVLRPGFAFGTVTDGTQWKKLLTGKSARIVITMGMPALAFRWFYRAHSLKALERNILGFCGIGPVRSTLIGMVEGGKADHLQKALRKLAKLGATAA